jgi:uncharacterized protein (DUF885 family)
MKLRLGFALLASIAAVAPVLPVAAQVSARPDAAAQLKSLFAESDEASLRRNPINAIFRGDMRFADRLGDYVSDSYFAAERRAAERDLERLARIDRSALGPTDRIAYDAFKWQQEQAVTANSEPLVSLVRVRPLNHFWGFHTFYPNFASGKSAAPFGSLADYENNLKRHRHYIVLLDRAIE